MLFKFPIEYHKGQLNPLHEPVLYFYQIIMTPFWFTCRCLFFFVIESNKVHKFRHYTAGNGEECQNHHPWGAEWGELFKKSETEHWKWK